RPPDVRLRGIGTYATAGEHVVMRLRRYHRIEQPRSRMRSAARVVDSHAERTVGTLQPIEYPMLFVVRRALRPVSERSRFADDHDLAVGIQVAYDFVKGVSRPDR